MLRRSLLPLILVGVLVGCSSSLRDEDGTIVEPGEISAFDLRVGDCFEQPVADEITQLSAVPCDQPHRNEVYAVAQHPADEEAPYPSAASMEAFAEDACLADAFSDYVGASYADATSIDVFPITPTAESWTDGDRAVACVLSVADPTTGSLRNSAS